MPEVPAPVVPRWKVTIESLPNGEANWSPEVSVTDVTAGEINHGLLKVATMLAAQPNARIPTPEEVKAEAARQEVAKRAPARRIYARAGEQLWLGDAALKDADALSRLALAGWVDAGSVPPGLVRASDDALDAEALTRACNVLDTPQADA